MRRRLVGLPGPGATAYLARALAAGRVPPGVPIEPPRGAVALVVREQAELEDLADAYAALAPLFPESGPGAALFGEDERGRLASLELLRAGARCVIVTEEALRGALPAPDAFGERRVRLSLGQKIKREAAIERLVAAGYQRVDFVESPGEFAARGAVLDFFGLEPLRAYRLLFDEDNIAAIRVFDPANQEIRDTAEEALAVPTEAPAGSSARLADWLGPEPVWIVAEGLEVEPPPSARVYAAGKLLEASPEDVDFGARPNPPTRGEPASAWAEMRRQAERGWRVLLFSLNRGEDQRVQELLEGLLAPGQAQFLIGPLPQGFSHEGLRLAVWATSEIFERRYRRAAGWKYFTAKSGLRLGELRQGDYVVHQDYGVSRYLGLEPVESPGHGVVDCLRLQFRGSDTLFVPMTDFGRVQKYSGSEGKRPRLSSLDTRRWEEVKRLVNEGVRELAAELLKISAERASRPGHAFPPDTPMEREFAEAFPFEETEDQARAISEVLADMAAPHPMDRLVIGDVGFGKTEVAMRAAFKCAAGFKQTAVLVPTTILADQHFRTFSARMAGFPVKLALLTRFQTKAEQKRVVEGLRSGAIDIVIATARLLQKDVGFKDLGLIVIDEEHRFGVKDKERLKSFRRTVDCLSLSATPIPRTLHQAMSGMRGISLIQSAPTGRQPIVTKVGPFNEAVVIEAISEELQRGGQVYYVHNRVRSLPERVRMLEKLLPRVRFGLVHGQMRGPQIEEAMWRFFTREYDVLAASTIIESGLDIPAVNTLIVEEAHEFGLAQLYQLRGRIGRERQRATCYLFFPEGELSGLSEDARRRLEALKEFGALGAGVKLAMRDLEIRGAGDLLGARQHGFINAVGVEFYTQLLNDEISRLRGRGGARREPEVHIDLRLPAFIPEDYLPGELQRLEFYKRILRATPVEAEGLRRELEELSGPAPAPVRNLFALLKARAAAGRAGARSVVQRGGRIELTFRSGAPVEPALLSRWLERYRGRIRFVRSEEGDGVWVDLLPEESALSWLSEFLALGASDEK